MPEENKAVQLKICEAINQGDSEALNDLYAPDFGNHAVQLTGLEANMQMLKAVLTTVFTDYEFKVEEIIAEGDNVAVRGVFTGTHSGEFMDRPATGKRVSVAQLEFNRFVDGKLAEHRGGLNMWELIQQIDAVPADE
jgi:steroid delta-isomerase-like uncharacterized protein